MMKKFNLNALFYLALFLLQVQQGQTEEPSISEDEVIEIYAALDDVVILENGIFLYLGENGPALPIKSISTHDSGLFLIELYNKERKCVHPMYCPSCKGCHPNNICQNRCKCPPRGRWN